MNQQTETTITESDVQQVSQESGTNELVLHLRPLDERRVTFTADTIDNEHLGRLKSNCCCIYIRPRRWDDPSTWEQDEHETEHCRGHTMPIEPEQQKPPNHDAPEKPQKQ